MKAESLYIQKLTYDENTGNEIIGLFPSEANPAIVSSYTYDAKRMGGAPTLTATIYSSEPLQWKKEEFVEYNDDRFFVSYTPSSTKNNSSKMWKSEITFTSRRELLDNTLFFDVVVDDVDTQNKDRYRSNQTKFTFGGTIHEFVARVNSSMAYCGLYRPTDEYKGYYVVVDEGYGTDEVKEVSFEDQYLTDVLQLINTTFELDYYWDGNVCHVGKVQHDLTDTPIKYGSSDALISVSKENANYKIVDMITGYGSSDNLPYYYPNDDEFGDAVFDVENINKDGVSIQLSKMVGCLGNANCYNNKLTLYNVINGKEVALKLNYASEFYWASSGESSSTDGQYSFGDNVRMFVDAKSGVHVDFSSLNIVCVYNGTGINGQYKLVTEQGVPRITIRWKNITTGEEGYVISDKNVGTTASMDIVSQGIYQFDVNYVLSYKSSSIRINTNGVVINLSAQKSDFTITKSGYLEMSYTPNYGNFVFKDAKGGKFYNLEDLGITMPILSSSEYYSAEYKFDSRKEDVNNSGSKVDVYYVGLHDADNGAENPVSITVIDRVWIAPSSVLMPSIYRNTKGAERFYYALNNTHKLPSGSGYYEFVNLYKKGNPHQGTVTFDGIKPTIKGIVNAEGQLFGEIADVAFDKEDSDVKDSNGKYIHNYFYIKLHKFNGDFGFDLFAHALASEPAKINLIKSNGCPACSFTIDCYWNSTKNKCYNNVLTDGNGNLKSDNGKMNSKGDYILNDTYVEDNKSNQDSTKEELWIAVQKDTSTLGIVMPNASAGFKPQKGDLFVITGIKPPKVLVTAAEKRLDDALIKHMSENNTDQFNYSVKFSRVFLQENTDFASKLNENAKLSIQIQGDSDSDGNLISHEVFVSNYSVKVDNDELAEVEIELVNSLEVTKSDTKQIIDAVKGETVKSLSSMVGGSNTNSFNASITDKMYLSKLKDDTANGTITFQKVQKFLQGLLVGGGSWTPDAEGRSHLITDYLEVRMKAIFEELVIKETSTIGGKEIISPAGGVVAHNVEVVTVTYNNVSQKAYRCYFLAEQEGNAVDNDFAVGDQVRSESFNVRKGTYHKAGNHFYWRLAIGRDEDPVELEGKKYHYIDLSDTDCATASDVPAKGDVLNQCGNRTDVERQNCLIFSAVDTYSPSISLYHGINSYSFANKEYVEYGVNKQTNKAFFNVYGDMYVGDRPTKENGYEGSSYIKYDSAAKQVSVKGKISAKSTVDGKELSQYIKENSAKGLTEEQVNNLIKNSQVITDLQNQVDGAIETWFYEGVPTLKNAPASSWATDKEKDTHLGDLYYDNKTGKAYRFAKDGNTYKWTIITDTDIAKALSDASKAQETADGKMKVFSTQPNPPYQVGDIWVNATYPADGSTYKNEVLRCQTAKGAGSQFAIGDWIKASKYTDDTVANAAKAAAEKAQKAAEKAQGDISKLGTTVTTNKKAFDSYVTDGYLEPSEIAAMAQDSKRLEDAFAAAEKSYNEVKGAEVLKSTKELTDLNTAFTTLSTAKTELVTYLSDISTNYNKADTNGKAAIVSAVGTKFTNFQSAYSAFYDKLGLANAYITSKIYGDLKQNITDLAGYKYLKDALGQTTDIDGGLVMTTLLALRDGDGNVQSGINGAIDPNRGKKSIATWWGGQMVDKDYNSGNLTPATSLIRFDGSGYLANGAIWWDVSGKVHADPTSFIISEKNLGAYLTFFEPTWKEGSAGTSVADLVSLKPNAPFSKLGVSGDATFEGAISFHGIKLTYDSKNKAIKIDGNLYATGGISAYGASDATSGGGGLNGSVKSYADALKLTSESLSEVASAYSIKALSRRIDNIATELGGLNLSWNNITGKPSTFTPSAHTHKWTEITDRITKVSQLTNDAGYLTAHQSLASYYTKSSVDSLLSGKSATSHTHSVKINGVTKTIAATGGTAVDLGTYLTSHQTIYGLTIQKNGTSLGTYTPNSAAKTINVTVPTKLSELSNDSGYTKNTGTVTSVAISVPTGLSVSGSPITTNGTIAIALASGYSIPTTAKQTAWDGAVSAKHTHSNKSVLDGISSTKVSHWNSAYDWYALMTTDEETADGIINKWNEVVSFLANIAQTDTLSGIVDGINKSISDEVARAKKAEGVNASGISTNKTSITTLQGYFTSGSAKKALQLTNARKLWGNSFNGTADINGSIIVPSGKYISIGNIKLEYDAANKALKITNTTTEEVANLYTSGGVSAYGVGASSSSGGGLNGSVKAYADSIKLTSENLSEIASAYSIAVLNNSLNAAIGRISTLEGGSATSIETTGSGNAVTSVSKSGTKITFTKGSTFSLNGHTHTFASLTSKPTSLSGYGITDGVNAVSVTGSGNAITTASISGHTLTLTKGSSFSLSNHTHYVGTTQVQGSSAEQALTGITKIDNILKLSKASVTVNTSYKAEQNRLVIYGSTYGNDANYIKSAGKLSYGDGGPQLVFSTSENPDASGVQSAALVYTDHDTIGAGVSLSFVTNQGDAYFIAPHIKALTAFQGNLAWGYITNKPTTLSGFGITDGLRSVTQPSGSNVFVTGISTSGTAITYTKSYTKKSLFAVGTSGWTNASIDGNIIPDMSFIAYWNGAYSGTSSNLAYCNKGAFGSFAIKNSLAFSELTSKPTTISGYGITDAYTKSQVDAIAAKYLPLTGGTLTGQLKIVASALNGAYNGLRIGNDCYIGDCNIGNTIGLMGVSNNNAGMVKFGKGGMQFGYNGSNHIASTTAQWTNLNADLLDGWHKDNIVWSGAVNSNTASLSHYWAKLFDITVTDYQYDDRSFTFLFSNGYNDTYSVVVLRIRQNGANGSGAYNFNISLRELVGNMSSRLRVYYNNATGNVQLWGNCQGQYGSLSYTIIKKTGRTSADFTSQGTLVTNTSFSAAQSLPATTGDSPYTLLDGATRIGIVKQADQLVTARSLWGQSFNGTANVSGNMTGVGNINTSAAPAGTIYTNNWFRSKGSTGWYSEDHGGGWYMSDNTWIRNFGGKDVYLSNKLCVNSNVGIGTTAPSHKLHVLGDIYTTTRVNINGIVLEKDSDGNLKVNGNLYATGGISAYGTSSAGSGGGLSGSVKSYADALKLASESLSEIASAYSIKQLSTRITSLEGGSATSISVSGGGNAVTSVTKNGTTISVVKGSTFSLSGHTHKWADITDRPSSLKNPSALSWSGYSSGSYDGSAAKSISIPNNTNQLTNGAGFITASASITGNAATATKVNHSLSVFGKSFNGSADVTVADTDLIASILTATANLTDKTEILTSYASDNGFNDSNSKNRIYRRPASAIWGYINSKTISNADKLDGVHASGLFTNLSNSGNNISITIGGTNKTLTAAYATNCDTVDGYHAQSGSSKPYGKIPVIGTDGVIELGHYIDFHHDNTTGSDYSVRLQTNGNHSNVVTLPTATGTLALTSGNVASATKLQTARTIWGQSFNGTANVSGALSGATTISASNTISTTLQNGALKIGNKLTPISAIDAQVIFNTGAAIRFGEKNWDWDEWAGLKYTHSNKTVYLGIADGSVFNANNAQSYGKLQLKAIDSILFDSDSDSFQIYCDNDYERLRIGSSDNSGYVLVSDIGNWDTDGEDEYGANNWRISIDGSSLFKKISCPSIYTADSITSTSNKALLLSGNVIREYHHGGSLYYSSITFKDTTLALSAYGNIGLTSTQGITIDGGSGRILMVATGGFDVTYRAASLSVSQTGASEYTWTFNNCSIKTTGGITAYQSSDERLKQDLRKLDYLGIIKAMGGTYGFAWKKDNTRSIGWIAQHVLHNPQLKDIVETDENGYYKINYWSPKLIAVAFGAIEQVDDEVSRLKRRVRDLENEVEQLKSDRL